MRILLLCEGDPETHDSWSGVTYHLVRSLRAAGHMVIPGDVDLYGAVRYLAALPSFSLSRQRWWVQFRLGALPFRLRSNLADRHVKRAGSRVDLVLQIGATFRVTPPPGVPLVLYCDSNILLAQEAADTGYSEASPLAPKEVEEIRLREERVYRSADLIFAMSHRLRRSFISDFGLPEGRVVTVHCGANIPVPVDPDEDGDARVILFVGRDFGRKGGSLLLDAFRRVRASRPEVRLRMVGGKPPGGSGESAEGVEFLGYLDRDNPREAIALERAYQTASLFCLPTRYEPFGTAFVEAMLYGLPCVGPNRWAVPEIIMDGETGVLAEPESSEALAEILLELLADPGRLREMGRAGRERALERFTWPRVTQRMLEALDPVVGGAVRRPGSEP